MKKIIFSGLLAFLITITGYAQSTDISGTVIDENDGLPLMGVTIRIKNTTSGTITDLDGNYSLKASPGDILQFSYVGYITTEIELKNRQPLHVRLRPDTKALEDVIVIGYGTARKSDLTGSVSSINTKELNPGPITNVSSMMKGAAAGLVMSGSSAQPGGGFDIRVRGTKSDQAGNQPLYVIDGFPMDSWSAQPSTGSYTYAPDKDPLNSINPNDILSIEILKDASATAIYGSRGANGVVMITTKKGQEGKTSVNYNGSYGIQTITKQWDLMDAQEYAHYYNTYINYRNSLADSQYHSGILPFDEDELREIATMGKGTDWQKEILRNIGQVTDHQVSLSGGNEKTKYYASLSYYQHKGIVKNTDLKRYSARINLDQKVSDRFSAGINFTGSVTDNQQIHFSGDEQRDGVFSARKWAPIWKVRDDNGDFTTHPVRWDYPNPVSLLDIQDDTESRSALLNAYLEYKFIPDLSLRLEGGYNSDDAIRGQYIPTSTIQGGLVGGEATKSSLRKSSLLFNALLNYNKQLRNDSNLSFLLGASYQNFIDEGFLTTVQNFSTEAFGYNNLGAGSTPQPPSSWKAENTLASYFVRFNYNLYDKYLFTFTGRADGSSRFGENNKWGYFPSGAVAWKINNEDFMKDITAISQLKLRASYGLTGNQEIDNYRSLSLLSNTGLVGIGNTSLTGIGVTSPGNPDLKWETSKQFEIGIDYGFFANRLTGSLNYYNIVTSDLLANFTLPHSTGFESIITNAGSTQNQGIELELRSYNLTGPLQWETSFNFSYNKNRWKDRAGLPYGIEQEHGPVGGLYGYVIEDVFKNETEVANSLQPNAAPGQWKIKDANDDEEITTDDRVLLGYWDPKYNVGMNNILTWKNWQLSFFLQGMFGHSRSEGLLGMYSPGDLLYDARTNLPRKFLNLFDANGNFDYNNPDMISNGTGNPYVNGGTPNSLTIEKANFVRLRNLTFSYTFDQKVLKNKINLARIYVDMQNLFTITSYSGLDPEVSGAYPNVRTYTIGVNFEF